MNRALHLIGLCVLPCRFGRAENIVLNTGFRWPPTGTRSTGGTVRIFSGDGVTEMPASLIASVEQVQEQPKSRSGRAAPVDRRPACRSRKARRLSKLPPIALALTAAQKYSLPDAFVAGVMHAESGFNPAAVSPKGAIGLMQLMPGTARDLGVDPKNPGENADGGARYLRDLLARYEDQPESGGAGPGRL